MDQTKWRCCRQKTVGKYMAFLMVLAAVLAVSLVIPRKVLADSSENRGSFPIEVGGTYRLSSHGGSAPYYWSSGNASVARVVPDKNNSNYATVYGISPGKTTIVLNSSKLVATWGGGKVENFRETWEVTVNPAEPTATPTPTPAPVTVKGVTLSKSKASLVMGKTLTLTASIRPSNAVTTLRWRSSASNVATVNANGLVTAKKAGTATITVTTANGRSASCKVTVKRPKATGIKLNKTKATIGIGETLKLKGKLSPSGASEKITWTSSNTKVAGVSTSGSVKAKTVGKTTITAKLASGVRTSCKVTVVKRPSSIKLNKTRLTLTLGKSQKLTYTLLPKKTVASVTWSSSNPKIASVDKNGKVKAVKAGTASITVKTVNGKKAVCKVTVLSPPAAKIRLSSSSLAMFKGEKAKLSYTLTPSDSADKPKWTSSNTKVAAVDGKGNITAKSAGTATVTAKISAKVFAKCTVKVKNKVPAASISIRASVPYLGVGETLKLKAAVSPSNTTDELKWSSEDPSIASVEQDGTVRGRKTGGTVIKAVAGKRSKSFRIAVVSGDIYDISKGRITVGDGKVWQAGNTYSYNAAAGITVVQSTPSTTNKICVNNLGNAIAEYPKTLTPIKIVLANVSLASSEAIDAYSAKDVTLELMAGTKNTLCAPWFGICSSGTDKSGLIIQGGGSLEVDAGGTAIRCSKLLIRSGTVTVRTESSEYAVIGDSGEYRYDDMDYSLSVLSGAKVTAYGGSRALGTDEDNPKYPIKVSVAQGSLTYYKDYKK